MSILEFEHMAFPELNSGHLSLSQRRLLVTKWEVVFLVFAKVFV